MVHGEVVPLRTRSSNSLKYLEPNASHARIYSEWRHLDAFRTLSCLQRAILQDILMGFSKVIGNEVRLTATQVMKTFNVGRTRARMAISGLEERGWIQRVGLGPGPTGQAGGVYEILCIDGSGRRVIGPYMQWTKTCSNKPTRQSKEAI